MAAQAASSRAPDAPLLSIGQVLARLTPDFPELSPSKLRFLEEQGLISPARTESGYRKFCSADLDRISSILALQRDHYLPLKVIRGYLEQIDSGHVPTLPGAVPGTPTMLPMARRFGKDDLLRESGASAALFTEAVSAALITPGETYGEEAVTVLRALVELGRAGVEPRHLRGYRAAAERDAALIESAIAPVSRRRTASSRARSAELALELAAQLERVRVSLLRSALGRVTNG